MFGGLQTECCNSPPDNPTVSRLLPDTWKWNHFHKKLLSLEMSFGMSGRSWPHPFEHHHLEKKNQSFLWYNRSDSITCFAVQASFRPHNYSPRILYKLPLDGLRASEITLLVSEPQHNSRLTAPCSACLKDWVKTTKMARKPPTGVQSWNRQVLCYIAETYVCSGWRRKWM